MRLGGGRWRTVAIAFVATGVLGGLAPLLPAEIGRELEFVASANAIENGWPKFRAGMWQFERTITASGQNVELPKAQRQLLHAQVTRCVDPSDAMRETFKPTSVGSCRSVAPQSTSNRHFFALRCDFTGPVRTVITVESDSAYVEIHESVGSRPRKIETITARRLGGCLDGQLSGSDFSAASRQVGKGGTEHAEVQP
jgi:hypothetical protein